MNKFFPQQFSLDTLYLLVEVCTAEQIYLNGNICVLTWTTGTHSTNIFLDMFYLHMSQIDMFFLVSDQIFDSQIFLCSKQLARPAAFEQPSLSKKNFSKFVS